MTCDWKTLNKNPCLKNVCVGVNRDGKSHAALRDTSWVKREKAPAVVTWYDAFWLSLIEPDWKIFSSLSRRAVCKLDQYISIKDNLSFFIPGIQVPWLASARPSVCSGERMSGREKSVGPEYLEQVRISSKGCFASFYYNSSSPWFQAIKSQSLFLKLVSSFLVIF